MKISCLNNNTNLEEYNNETVVNDTNQPESSQYYERY